MNTRVLLGGRPDPEVLTKMRSSRANFPGTRWAAYENHELGHWALGHLKFLAVGPQNTFKDAPARMPDTERELNWRYVHIGFVDLATGSIFEK
ncbi:MAG TPA: hypothetical protein VN578_21165 [Candidatus Binatia bacterium]|jgi:hypothetical protein|nr:hypothetical protein [Candidatus Binatia bacterium]